MSTSLSEAWGLKLRERRDRKARLWAGFLREQLDSGDRLDDVFQVLPPGAKCTRRTIIAYLLSSGGTPIFWASNGPAGKDYDSEGNCNCPDRYVAAGEGAFGNLVRCYGIHAEERILAAMSAGAGGFAPPKYANPAQNVAPGAPPHLEGCLLLCSKEPCVACTLKILGQPAIDAVWFLTPARSLPNKPTESRELWEDARGEGWVHVTSTR